MLLGEGQAVYRVCQHPPNIHGVAAGLTYAHVRRAGASSHAGRAPSHSTYKRRELGGPTSRIRPAQPRSPAPEGMQGRALLHTPSSHTTFST